MVAAGARLGQYSCVDCTSDGISDADCKKLLSALRRNESVTKLDLASNRIGPEARCVGVAGPALLRSARPPRARCCGCRPVMSN